MLYSVRSYLSGKTVMHGRFLTRVEAQQLQAKIWKRGYYYVPIVRETCDGFITPQEQYEYGTIGALASQHHL